MTAKEYLSQYKRIKARLNAMAEQYEHLKAAVVYLGVEYSELPKPPTPNPYRGEEAIVRMMEMEARMNKEFAKLADINETIERLPDPLHQAVLVKRYISGKAWEDIKMDLFVSLRQIHRLHSEALMALEKGIKAGT